MNSMRHDADTIIKAALKAAQPDEAVRRALSKLPDVSGRLVLVAIGKAAWQMASAACEALGERLSGGIVITKYGHDRGELPGVRVFEAGHPVPDENSYAATRSAIELAETLGADDMALFLVSGGGSALFEAPLIPIGDMERLTQELLSSGADIVEMNTVRKRFSAVKGGRFAKLCAPAGVFSVVLSDIVGDPLDMIASGPAYPDSSTAEDARAIAKKYRLTLTEEMERLLSVETPKQLYNVETHITGSVTQLCLSAERTCAELGYRPLILTSELSCAARDAGVFLGDIARYHRSSTESLAFIAGGETVVRLVGSGRGGRNQELALSAAERIGGIESTAIFSLGSDGTDGPTDAAGGYVDGETLSFLREAGMDIFSYLENNDSYTALKACGGLIITGPTGTNVNDVVVVLIRR